MSSDHSIRENVVRRLFLSVSLAILALLFVQGAATANSYPQRPITLITPFGAGGASDLAGRAFAQAAAQFTNKTILVVNKDGGGGIVGSQWVRAQRKDGYTLLITRVGAQAMAPAFNTKTPFRWDQFTFIGMLQSDPVVFLVNANAPYQSLEELFATIKEKPGALSYSTSGPFTIQSLVPQLMFQQSKIDIKAAKMISYKGGGAAITALLGGHVDFLACNLGEAKAQLEAGTLRALAVSTRGGHAILDNAPLLSDLGFKGLEELMGWTGLYGPENLPQPIVDYWKDILKKVENDPTWQEMVLMQGCTPFILSPEETKEFVGRQFEMYKGIKETLLQSAD